MFERPQFLAGTVDERRRDEMRVCGAETEYAAAVVTEDLLEGKHHRLLTVSISLQESASPLDGSEALDAPSGLEVVALGDVVRVDVHGRESFPRRSPTVLFPRTPGRSTISGLPRRPRARGPSLA